MSAFQECSRCLMSTSADPMISFDSAGLCSHCQRYDQLLHSRVEGGETRDAALERLVDKIKRAGKGKRYDCLIGVSGGVDSTYVAFLAKSLGLRPLAVHFDNGWNSNLAVENIEKTLDRLNIDLDTYVVDWDEFADLQLSFLKASVPDGEIPTDHGIDALVWRKAAEHGIKFILSGMNFATESISVTDWSYGHSDWRYIKSVHRKFGGKSIKSFPKFNFFDLFYFNVFKRIRIVSILNYIHYDKNEAMETLKRELEWTPYGGKHYESVYTRFYQGYVLPKKFGVHKKIGHLSDLINSGQISKEDARKMLEQPDYDAETCDRDLDFVLKKFELTKESWDEIMERPIKSFRDYPNSYSSVQMLRDTVNTLRSLGLYPK